MHRSRRSITTGMAVVAAVATSLALSGCSQLNDIVGEVLPDGNDAHVLEVGQCFNTTTIFGVTGTDFTDVPRENCTLSHDNEVIAGVQLSGSQYPGDDAMLAQGHEHCLPEFETFIGVDIESAGSLDYAFFAPSATSWELGDRELLCYVFDSAGQTEFSLRDAGAERMMAESTEPEADDSASA